MSGTSVAGPRLNAYPSRNSRPAPKEYIREPLCIYPQIAPGFPFFQLKPIRSKVGETDAVVVKKGRGQVQSVGPTGYLRLFKSDAVVLDTVSWRKGTAKARMEPQLHRHSTGAQIDSGAGSAQGPPLQSMTCLKGKGPRPADLIAIPFETEAQTFRLLFHQNMFQVPHKTVLLSGPCSGTPPPRTNRLLFSRTKENRPAPVEATTLVSHPTDRKRGPAPGSEYPRAPLPRCLLSR